MSSQLHIVSIVLDGMPWLPMQIANYEALNVDWHLYLVHGAAAPTGSTRWCRPQIPRFSRDGTSEYINEKLLRHPRVTLIQRQLWEGGKDQMVNTALAKIKSDGVLFVPDADEIFTPKQIHKIVELFDGDHQLMRLQFWCRYFLGPNIISTSRDGYGNRRVGEWVKSFRYQMGMAMNSHEPIVLAGNKGRMMTRDETAAYGLVFDHHAWVTEEQARYKEQFYGYANALGYWKKLQSAKFPVSNLQAFLPWVGPNASADLITNQPNFPL